MLKNLISLRPVMFANTQITKNTVKCIPKSLKDFDKVFLVRNVRCCYSQDLSDNNYANDGKDEEPITDEDIKRHILEESMQFVATLGWSVDALSEGAKAVGYPGVAHGMFERGGGDLMHYFVANSNRNLAQQLAEEVKQSNEDPDMPKKKVSQFIRDAIEVRLGMIIPYLNQWPQAMALTALPSNTVEHFKNISTLMDDIWFYAGDRSTDMNWYSKRLTLLALYKSTELHLIQDNSTDYERTWRFLDNRIADLNSFSKSTASIDVIATSVGDLATAAFTVGKNVIGLNNTNR